MRTALTAPVTDPVAIPVNWKYPVAEVTVIGDERSSLAEITAPTAGVPVSGVNEELVVLWGSTGAAGAAEYMKSVELTLAS